MLMLERGRRRVTMGRSLVNASFCYSDNYMMCKIHIWNITYNRRVTKRSNPEPARQPSKNEGQGTLHLWFLKGCLASSGLLR
jgi:hypothetical protein